MAIKLLFADDSVTMQKVIQLTLENENMDLLFAGDGNKAYEMVKEHRPDVIVADVYMPGLDGFQLCKKVKGDPSTAGTPVILISGELENYDPGQGEAAGADAHITKPFKSGEFIELVKKYSREAAPAAKKSAKAKAAPAKRELEDELDDELDSPAVLELVSRIPSGKPTPASGDDELEVVDEDIENLADGIDALDEELDEEILETGDDAAEEADGEEVIEEVEETLVDEEPPAVPPLAAAKGTVELDHIPAAKYPEDAGGIDIFMHDGGDVLSEAVGDDLPPALDISETYLEAAPAGPDQILAEVLNIPEPPAEPPAQRADDALEEALASLGDELIPPAPGKTPPPTSGDAENELDAVLASANTGLEEMKADDIDSIWEKPKREIEEAVRREIETYAVPEQTSAAGTLSPDRMEDLFREAAARAVEDFIAARAETLFREELRRALEERVKAAFETQLEKAFREEIGRVMAAGFQKAMPRMLAIIDKITVQITPRIAQHMIKIAIERIKKGEIN